MANFKDVNKAIKAAHPSLDITAVRSSGYVYFTGAHGESMDSLYAHPTSTDTADMISLVLNDIDYSLSGLTSEDRQIIGRKSK